MKIVIPPLVFAIAVLNHAAATIPDFLKQDVFNIYTHTAFEIRDIRSGPVTLDQIKYYLFTRDNPNKGVHIDPEDPRKLVNTNVSIVFLIHGWTSDSDSGWYEDLKNAFLNRDEEYYVVEVDWKEPANQLYTVSSFNTKDIGTYIGEFLTGLNQNYSIPLNNFLLVGHSLGGQVCGYTGKKVYELTGEKLPRIVALDPAGPFFSTRPKNETLNKNDAEVVVVHSDAGTFGFKDSCGTIDFFPNGGNLQPGCTRIDLLDISSVTDPIMCDHQRSHMYFVEAVLNPKDFLAKKCSSWYHYRLNMCDDDEEVTLGNLKTTKSGNFYFATNRDRPFALKGKWSELTFSQLPKVPELPKVPKKIFG